MPNVITKRLIHWDVERNKNEPLGSERKSQELWISFNLLTKSNAT